ncbi:phosphoribosylglycinamide formyltransferase [bacterium 1XD42-1]|nr:phosphoribosylglycinamide formyltransferase [bacterium 1XD42-8]RKJ67014.1 phosphoribosylglycinamide formyltransferase [bacterium 1XD42-1]
MLKRVVVLVSGGGTNLQALIDAQQRGELKNGFLACVISSNPDAYALERARQAGISTKVVSRKSYASWEAYDEALLAALKEAQADLIVLAGFLLVLGEKVVKAYDRRMINVHPSLIPSFCGDGYYGLRVHEAALEYGVKVTGATVHFVNEVTDGGQIILQKAVDIHEDDTPESLQKRVMEEAEWVLLPKAVSLFCEGKL